jgi:hypothetical protein
MLQPSDDFDISKVMQFLKRHTSRNINICMGYASWPRGATPESDIGQCRFQDGEMVVQCNHKTLIQKLHKFDIFVRISKTRFQIKYENQKPFPKFRWQKSFIDHYIRSDWDFNDKLEYIAWNPDKHGLPADWPYVYTNPEYDDLNDEIL